MGFSVCRKGFRNGDKRQLLVLMAVALWAIGGGASFAGNDKAIGLCRYGHGRDALYAFARASVGVRSAISVRYQLSFVDRRL